MVGQVFFGVNQQAAMNEGDELGAANASAATAAAQTFAREIVFIETNIADWQTLAAGVSPNAEVVLLDAARDGLAQMAEWASTHSDYDAIHILSHGSQGALQLGSVMLTEAELAEREDELATLGRALTADGDLLLYGCEVAAGDEGIAFIRDLAAATGADVAASDDLTGAAAQDGDWLLEKHVGSVDAESVALSSFAAALDMTGAKVDFGAMEAVIRTNTVGVGNEITISPIIIDVDPLGQTVTIYVEKGKSLLQGFDLTFSEGDFHSLTNVSLTSNDFSGSQPSMTVAGGRLDTEI